MPSKTEDQSSGQAQESMQLLMSTGERSHLNRWISWENLSWTTSTSNSSPGLQAIEWVSDQQNQPFAGTLRKPPVTPSSAFWQYLDFHWASPLYSVNTLRVGRQIWNGNSHVYWHLLLQITGKLSFWHIIAFLQYFLFGWAQVVFPYFCAGQGTSQSFPDQDSQADEDTIIQSDTTIAPGDILS